MKPFSGKTAVVTGSSRGIGRAIAIHLAAEGANVVLTARDAPLLEAASQEIADAGGKSIRVVQDLRAPGAGTAIVRTALAAFGSLDILVNNAGATKRGDFVDLSDEDFQDGFALKFFGAVRLTRAAWPHLRERRGAVVFVAGSGGRTPGAQFTIGGPVNAALLSFTKAMADLGIRDGVQVNAVNPGPVRTARLDSRVTRIAQEKAVSQEDALRILVAQEKVVRVAEPEEIAALIGFITGPNGRSMHGSLIDIDGGTTKTI